MSSWEWREACSWGLPAHSPVGLAQAAAVPPWPVTLPPWPGVPQICPVSAISADASCSEVPVMKLTEVVFMLQVAPGKAERGGVGDETVGVAPSDAAHWPYGCPHHWGLV